MFIATDQWHWEIIIDEPANSNTHTCGTVREYFGVKEYACIFTDQKWNKNPGPLRRKFILTIIDCDRFMY